MQHSLTAEKAKDLASAGYYLYDLCVNSNDMTGYMAIENTWNLTVHPCRIRIGMPHLPADQGSGAGAGYPAD